MGHLQRISTALENLWKERPTNTEGYVIVSEPSVSSAIHDLTLNFGMLSTTLFDRGPKRSSENSAIYDIRKKRIDRIDDIFQGIDLSIYEDRSIRHRYVHSDEHISRLLIQNPKATILQNIALSDRAAIQSEFGIIYVRVYTYADDKVLHLGAEFSARSLYETNFAIAERLKKLAVELA